mgnify:FL=1
MKISANVEIIARKDGSLITIINGVSTAETDSERIVECTQIYQACRDMEEDKREAWLNENIADGKFPHLFGDASSVGETEKVEPTPTEYLQSALQRLMDFFKEFEFEPNFRFVNTLAWMLTKKKKSCATDYIASYFELIDSPYKNEVSAKIKSKEFKAILADMSKVAPTKTVNERFKLYYGSQGTGKTTIGQTESDGRCIVCNASMLPADLMEDFVFDSGKPSFTPSMLWNCMEDGKAIVLDEINLLPFDSLRFLQGVLDGKKEFNYKGKTVHINSGFMVIGTMNLSVNGMVYGLPEPLVDRCMEMKKFSLDAKALMGAIA